MNIVLRPLVYGFCLMLVIAAGACSLFQESPVAKAKAIEPMLSAAGFNMLPADNDQKIGAIKSLPPLKMRYDTKDGQLRYWFADPDYCNCVYVGNEAAYQRYQSIRIQTRNAQTAEMAAELNQDAAVEAMSMPPFFWY